MEPFLSRGEERSLLRIARETVSAAVGNGASGEEDAIVVTPALFRRHGAFVTLRNSGALRGCMGSLGNAQPLVASVCTSAIRAA